MKTNVGNIDRTLRIVAGLAILSLFLVLDEGQRGWALLGLVPLVTGLVSWCPLYTMLGIRTCKMASR
jgi:hypothetical protein